MKLSEAIRVGMRTTKPKRRDFLERRGNTVYACAIGAAIVAMEPEIVNMEPEILEGVGFDEAEKIFPQLLNLVTYPLPDTGTHQVELWFLITTLNDRYLYRRDVIASVVERLGY